MCIDRIWQIFFSMKKTCTSAIFVYISQSNYLCSKLTEKLGLYSTYVETKGLKSIFFKLWCMLFSAYHVLLLFCTMCDFNDFGSSFGRDISSCQQSHTVFYFEIYS